MKKILVIILKKVSFYVLLTWILSLGVIFAGYELDIEKFHETAVRTNIACGLLAPFIVIVESFIIMAIRKIEKFFEVGTEKEDQYLEDILLFLFLILGVLMFIFVFLNEA